MLLCPSLLSLPIKSWVLIASSRISLLPGRTWAEDRSCSLNLSFFEPRPWGLSAMFALRAFDILDCICLFADFVTYSLPLLWLLAFCIDGPRGDIARIPVLIDIRGRDIEIYGVSLGRELALLFTVYVVAPLPSFVSNLRWDFCVQAFVSLSAALFIFGSSCTD